MRHFCAKLGAVPVNSKCPDNKWGLLEASRERHDFPLLIASTENTHNPISVIPRHFPVLSPLLKSCLQGRVPWPHGCDCSFAFRPPPSGEMQTLLFAEHSAWLQVDLGKPRGGQCGITDCVREALGRGCWLPSPSLAQSEQSAEGVLCTAPNPYELACH